MSALDDVREERGRQDAKWGEQNHPDLCPVLTNREPPADAARHAEDLEVPTANRARGMCQAAFAQGHGSYALIALEEFCEAIEAAAEGTRDELRAELIQCAAVFVAWAEKVDRDAKATGAR